MPITQDLRGSKLLLLGAEPLAARVRKHEAIPKPNKQTIHTPQTSLAPSRTLASYQIQIPLLGSPEGEELVSLLLRFWFFKVLLLFVLPQRCRNGGKRQRGRATEIDRQGEERIEILAKQHGQMCAVGSLEYADISLSAFFFSSPHRTFLSMTSLLSTLVNLSCSSLSGYHCSSWFLSILLLGIR